MRSLSAAFVVAALVATGCGGSAEPTSGEPEPTLSTAPVTPHDPGEVPGEIALVEVDLVIEGHTGLRVAPGEMVTVNHLVYNQADASRSLGFRVRHGELDEGEPEPFVVDLSHKTIRVDASQIVLVQSTVEVPADASADDVLTYDVVVVDVDDIAQRAATTVELHVRSTGGARPELGADTGRAATNEKVLVYVVGDDTDPDGDMVLGSLRVIAGGFRADQAVSVVEGFVTYVPFANVTGTDMLLYELCDQELRCSSAPVTITVEG